MFEEVGTHITSGIILKNLHVATKEEQEMNHKIPVIILLTFQFYCYLKTSVISVSASFILLSCRSDLSQFFLSQVPTKSKLNLVLIYLSVPSFSFNMLSIFLKQVITKYLNIKKKVIFPIFVVYQSAFVQLDYHISLTVLFSFFCYQVMKPMLERKRRARINRCLDELKELMVTALQAEGENVSKLEKADILELTVQHLQKMRRQQRLAANPVTDADRFRAGFTHCANEVSKCLASTPGIDLRLGTKLMSHLGQRLNDMDKLSPLSVRVVDVCTPPPSPHSDTYSMPLTPASSGSSQMDSCDYTSQTSSYSMPSPKSMWRPW